MNPILREIPDSIETERLIIRSPMPGDGLPLYRAVAASQEHLKPWMPWAMTLPTPEQYEIRVREGRLKWLSREDLWMMLLLKDSDIIIGGSGLHRIDWAVPRFEIGYWVRTAYGRQGYITEAVAGITDFAFRELGANRVEIRCDSLNLRSAAVPQRLGFVHEATLVNEARHHQTNALRDTMIFARTTPK